MDNHNFDGQPLFFKSDLETDDQLPSECATNICAVSLPVPSYVEQPQNLVSDTYFSPLPSPVTQVGFGHYTGHLRPEYESLPYSPTVMGTVDCSVASNPGPCQSQWMNSSLTHKACTSAPYLQNQYQTPHGTLCGWTQDFESFAVESHSITNNPQSLPPMQTHANPDAEQYDAYMRYILGGTVDTCSSSPIADTALSASGFLGAFADYDFPLGARADPQPSISLTHNAMSSIQSTALPYSEPICAPDGQTRTFECQWLTNGVLCGVFVVADRRSVIKHLRAHDIRSGEDKARQSCLWESCTTILNRESLVRHILTVHLKEGVICIQCGLSFAREDSLKRHLKGGQHKVPSDKNAAGQPVRNHAGSRRPEH